MKIQSLSIVVPTKGCVNACPFCVSCMHENPLPVIINWRQYEKRLIFAHNNGVNTLVITGTGEPLQNVDFLRRLEGVLFKMKTVFPNREIQTTGVMLQPDKLRDLEINTVSLSLCNVFDSKKNWDMQQTPRKLRVPLEELCKTITGSGFNLRLSLNLTDSYKPQYEKDRRGFAKNVLVRCKELGAQQVVFRKMYHSDDQSKQSEWVKTHDIPKEISIEIERYIMKNGKILYTLPFGTDVYSIEGLSTVIDKDCMSKDNTDSLKYVILRENGKLYCRWDDEGSLIF